MKSLAPLSVIVVGCLLTVACERSPQASGTPPGTSYQVNSLELRDGGASQQVRGASVTSAFFQGVKVEPKLGRSFLPEDFGAGRQQQVVMLSERFWQQKFRGDPRMIGAMIRLNGQPFTVIGVMPAAFEVPSGADLWVPKIQNVSNREL
jgi:putative ABC transport system permease protein